MSAISEYIANGDVKAGALKLRGRDAFEQAVKQFKDGPVTLSLERLHATRSEQQNRWYWSDPFMGAIGRQVGELSKRHAHELCKQLFNARVIVLCDSNGVIVGEHAIAESTTRLNKLTFGEYCEAIRTWAAQELHIDIPDPDPNWREKEEAAA